MTLQWSVMLSDQGTNVDGKLVGETLEKFRMRKVAAHPEGDSQSERGVQIVKQVMRCLLVDT